MSLAGLDITVSITDSLAYLLIIGEQFLQILGSFLSQDILTSAMTALATGLITVTIAVAIFLGENGELFEFDRKVILKEIVKSKSFLRNFLFLFLPLFVWNASPTVIQLLLFVLYASGVYGFLAFLYRSYKWIREIEIKEEHKKGDYRQQKRQEYLESIQPSQKNLIIWEYLWELDHISISEEQNYVEKFVNKVSSLLEEGSIGEAEEYLLSLNQSLDSISLQHPTIFEELWKASFDWHEKIFKRSLVDSDENNYRLERISKKIVSNLTETGLSSDNGYYIFNFLKNTVSNKSDSEDGREYIDEILGILAPIIFSNSANGLGRSTLWNYFPEEWKITLEHLEDESNFMAGLWLKQFVNWAEPRIQGQAGKEGIDKPLDTTLRGLFPDADPRIFSIILSFVYMGGWPSGKRMKTFVEGKRSFGFASHSHAGFAGLDESWESGLDEMIEEETENAIELGSRLFEGYFTEDRLDDWIEELEELDLEDELRNSYREHIIEIFKRLNEQVDSQGDR